MLEYDPRDWYWRVASVSGQVFSSARGVFVRDDDATYQAWVEAGGHTTRIANQQELGAVLAARQVRPTDVDVLDAYKDELAQRIISRPEWRVELNHENRIRAIERALSLNGSPPPLTNGGRGIVKALM